VTSHSHTGVSYNQIEQQVLVLYAGGTIRSFQVEEQRVTYSAEKSAELANQIVARRYQGTTIPASLVYLRTHQILSIEDSPNSLYLVYYQE
jgi:hypothetical protein